jgi:hypothetical protein
LILLNLRTTKGTHNCTLREQKDKACFHTLSRAIDQDDPKGVNSTTFSVCTLMRTKQAFDGMPCCSIREALEDHKVGLEMTCYQDVPSEIGKILNKISPSQWLKKKMKYRKWYRSSIL